MARDEIKGARVEVSYLNENNSWISKLRHPLLYDDQVLETELISIDDETSLLDDLEASLAPWVRLSSGLYNMISDERSLDGFRDIVGGLKDTITNQNQRFNDIKKFRSTQLIVEVPYPHPSGLKKIRILSMGFAQSRYVSPDHHLLKKLPGFIVENSVWEKNWGQIDITIDLDEITKTSYWKSYFVNDNNSEKYIPFIYSYKDGHCGVLIFILLKIRRYNVSPVIRFGLNLGGISDYSFVHPQIENIKDGYNIKNHSKSLHESTELEIIKWKDDRYSYGYKLRPIEEFKLSADSVSNRLRFDDKGSYNKWGAKLNITLDKSKNSFLKLPEIRLSSNIKHENFENNIHVNQTIKGRDLNVGESYPFRIEFQDGNLMKVVRLIILKIVKPNLNIQFMRPRRIKSKGYITLKGEFGFCSKNYIDDSNSYTVSSMLKSVKVGDYSTNFKFVNDNKNRVRIGPIKNPGPVTLYFNDSSKIKSPKTINIIGLKITNLEILNFEPDKVISGEILKIHGRGFTKGRGDAKRNAIFQINGRKVAVINISSSYVELKINPSTSSGYITCKFDDAKSSSYNKLIIPKLGPPE